MKILIPSIAVLMTVGYGCASKKPPETMQENAAVTDVRPGPQPVAEAGYAPAPAPEPLVTQTPSTPGPTAQAGGSSYTVQKGDTLFRIAKQHYGDGKQWQRIAAANPGLSPQSLKAGQKVYIP